MPHSNKPSVMSDLHPGTRALCSPHDQQVQTPRAPPCPVSFAGYLPRISVWKALLASLTARWCFPLPPVRDERFIYSGADYGGSPAYLGKLPIHHRRAEFSRHECLFYEHLHAVNAASREVINARIVHAGNTLYLLGKKNTRWEMV